jgi:hypothetical protein
MWEASQREQFSPAPILCESHQINYLYIRKSWPASCLSDAGVGFMDKTWALIALAAAVVAFAAARLFAAWFRQRGARVITCPETARPAGVEVDALHAAFTSFGAPDLRLSTCTRWPERAGCGQECLSQIQESPEGCLVRNILAEWYRGKSCASCGQPFAEIEWKLRKPALISADKVSREWSCIAAERLTETLQTALPVCFACHMASTLVREHPDLVTDRSRRISV